MPLALIAAALASLGIHAALLFGPEIDLAPAPEPLPLQAEIVLQPRTVPKAVAAVPLAKKEPQRAKPREAVPNAPHGPVAALPPTPDTTDAAPAETEVTAAAPVGEFAPADAVAAAGAGADAPTPAPPAELALPPRGEIRYTVLLGDPAATIGRSVQSWELQGTRYRIVSVTETVGLVALLKPLRIEAESRGRIVAGGLEPESYSTRRQDKAGGERVDFDWAAGVARFSRGGTSPLSAGAQDLLSFNFQLGWLARPGDMAIATTKKLATYRLRLLGEEQLETPMGRLRTLHFRAPGETTTEVWLAPERYLLPVKIRHIDKKGEIYDQLAEAIRIPE